ALVVMRVRGQAALGEEDLAAIEELGAGGERDEHGGVAVLGDAEGCNGLNALCHLEAPSELGRLSLVGRGHGSGRQPPRRQLSGLKLSMQARNAGSTLRYSDASAAAVST